MGGSRRLFLLLGCGCFFLLLLRRLFGLSFPSFFCRLISLHLLLFLLGGLLGFIHALAIIIWGRSNACLVSELLQSCINHFLFVCQKLLHRAGWHSVLFAAFLNA